MLTVGRHGGIKQKACSAGDSGFVTFGTMISVDNGGTVWVLPNNAKTSDDNRASSNTSNSPNFSDYLVGSDAGIIVPPSATITLYEARVEGRKTIAAGSTVIGQLQFHINNSLVGDPSATFELPLIEGTQTESEDVGADALWGLLLSPSQINNPNFGVSLITQETVADGGFSQVDLLSMKITWTCP